MRRATVVIGGAMGDEGKGLLTDYYASHGKKPIVVRFSGGANAGHTVVLPNGRRHVFSHFGAGMFSGAATHLSKYFVVNPLLWRKEARELQWLGEWSRTSIDGHAMLSTPYDMLINQFAETSRGGKRHGSVGVGINETVHRCSIPFWHTPAAYIGKHFLKPALLDIRDGYVFQRLDELGIKLTQQQFELIMSEALIDDFIAAADEMAAHTFFSGSEILHNHETIIFEGSQGLLLDEKHEFFPHVTRARTGLTNATTIAKEIGLTDLDVTYVTRAYTTRHGSGPLPHEDPGLRYRDDTNQPNEWQGTLRFAPLDAVLLGKTIMADMHASSFPNIHTTLAVTHLDQVAAAPVQYCIGADGFCERGSWQELVRACKHAAHIDHAITSFGPTRNDVSEFASAKRIYA